MKKHLSFYFGKMACPKTISGPAMNPLRVAWLTVTTSTGPGMSAPERPTKNEVKKICGRFSITNLWMSKT